ncbi:MAG: hypothetical protein V5A34_12085 [Halapricum sp.]
MIWQISLNRIEEFFMQSHAFEYVSRAITNTCALAVANPALFFEFSREFRLRCCIHSQVITVACECGIQLFLVNDVLTDIRHFERVVCELLNGGTERLGDAPLFVK